MAIKDNVLIIADSWEYLQFYIKEKMNLNIVLFQSPERSNRDKEELCEEIYYLDLTDKEKATRLAKDINKKYNFKAVWSFTDEGVELAARISKSLGLTHNPEETSRLLNNKELMRQFLETKGFENISYKLISNQSDLTEFAEKVGFPFIVKPTNGTASKDVVRLENKEQLYAYISNIESDKISLLAEEYLQGPEFSVETISFNGLHEVIQITEKRLFPKSNIEMAHLMPCNIELDRKQEIKNFILDFLDSISHKNGPCHIEIKLTSSGPKLIEGHTRPGGDFIVLVLADIFGVDVICETLNFVINGKVPQRQTTPSQGGVVRYFYDKPGKLISVRGFDEVIKHPNVINYEFNFKVGDTIPELGNSFSRMGCLVVKDESSNKAYHLAEKLIQKIEYKVV